MNIKLLEEIGLTTVANVNLKFSGPFSGVSSLIFSESNADEFVALLTAEMQQADGIEMLRAGVLMEVGNIVLNSVMGSFGNVLDRHFEFGMPEFFVGSSRELFDIHSNETSAVLLALCRFSIQSSSTTGHIILILDVRSLQSLLSVIDEWPM